MDVKQYSNGFRFAFVGTYIQWRRIATSGSSTGRPAEAGSIANRFVAQQSVSFEGSRQTDLAGSNRALAQTTVRKLQADIVRNNDEQSAVQTQPVTPAYAPVMARVTADAKVNVAERLMLFLPRRRKKGIADRTVAA